MRLIRSANLSLWLPVVVMTVFIMLLSMMVWVEYRQVSSQLIKSSLHIVPEQKGASLQKSYNPRACAICSISSLVVLSILAILPQARSVSEPILLVASIPIFPPRPGLGLAKSR